MKYKITRKLILFITAVLVVFSIIIGLSFSILFTRHTIDFHKRDMARRAEIIASSLADFLDLDEASGSRGMGMGMGMTGMRGFMPYLNVIDDIAMSDVWIVDKNNELILMGRGTEVSYGELPDSADVVIGEAMKGNIHFSESFSDLLGTRTLTVGAPVISSSGDILAVVLLHAPIDGMESATTSGLQILVASTLVALILSIGLAVLLSLKFIKPLRQMTLTAARLSEGDYSVKTDVHQNDEIGELAETLDILSGRLAEASLESERLEKTRRDFISSVSHELRTPVTVLRGSLEALKDKVIEDPRQVEEYHHQMFLEIIALQRLVDDLLSLTKLQNPDFRMQMEKLNLNEILSDVVRSMGTIARNKDIELIYENPYRSLVFNGDYGRLRQMIMVVMDNAIKFSDPGEKVKVAVAADDLICRVSVEDHGKGIPKDELESIFDRFQRTEDSRNIPGTGLGLAIAKEIANRHQVEIAVESIPEKATVFTFRFELLDRPEE